MKLSAGERYPLTDEKMYIVLTSGEAEVYAVTKQQDSFRQMFLTELSPGAAAFPSLDEFGMVDVVVYAVDPDGAFTGSGGVSFVGRVRHGRRGGLRRRS